MKRLRIQRIRLDWNKLLAFDQIKTTPLKPRDVHGNPSKAMVGTKTSGTGIAGTVSYLPFYLLKRLGAEFVN